MRDDPPLIWDGEYSGKYEQANYGRSLAGFVMRKSHPLVERHFGSGVHFSRVLEVGAGSGIHLRYVQHSFDEYWLTDSSTSMLVKAREAHQAPEKVKVSVEDASRLSFGDASFDRVIATHVLEHIYRPHEVLREWVRVLRRGGVLSLVLPCDPGLLWRLGRSLGPRRRATTNGLAYDYVMAREHVNSINNLVVLIRYYFDRTHEIWWPTRIPLSDVNLIYTVNIEI
jgi:phosphatidylethanolamine/phosphatidyl-N-methylethanolamine N-methyltransferase